MKKRAFLFTCIATCAVHIKIDPFKETISRVLAIETLMSCRKDPSVWRLDKCTNFVGLEKDLLLCVGKGKRPALPMFVH